MSTTRFDLSKVEGFDDIRHFLRRLKPAGLRRYSSGVLRQIVYATEAEIKPYPPNGPWNQPHGPGSHWYERHFGPRWMTVGGEIRGRNTSQRLQQQWRRRKISHFEWELANDAGYSGYVVGLQQYEYHKKHGWPNVNSVLRVVRKQYLPRIIRFFVTDLTR